eukprot:2151273-Rhodomonas_salina.1
MWTAYGGYPGGCWRDVVVGWNRKLPEDGMCAAVTTVTMAAVATAVSASATTVATAMATLPKLHFGVPMQSSGGP